MQHIRPYALLFAICVGALPARSDEVVFADALGNPAMPGWRKAWKPGTPVAVGATARPGGGQAVRFTSREAVFAVAVHDLPAEKLSGKRVILSIWRKADGIVTGDKHYRNAKTMLIWRGAADEKTMNPGTARSDLKGTSDWEHHRYLVHFPEDLQFARVHLGLEGCTGSASFTDLSITITDRFADEAAFARFLADEEEKALAEAARGPTEIRHLPGGIPRVFAAGQYLPWQLWTETMGQRVLAAVPKPAKPTGTTFAHSLGRALLVRADELAPKVATMEPGEARNRRIAAIGGLRSRADHIRGGAPGATPQAVKPTGSPVSISPLLFGNNINAEHLGALYDAEKGSFHPEFLERVRPMGIRFLRYPGGCNADVFDWRASIGPMATRGNFMNYHNGDPRGPMKPGLDDVLRWCERDGMVPILTTAFLYDKPDRIDLATHPRVKQKPYIVEYLKTAGDRVALAADWVEYCNGDTGTPMGALRARNGHPKPYGVKYWEVGNESWGADPVGSTTAENYAKAFPSYVRAMRQRDPTIHVLLNGHGNKPEWNETILRLAGQHADGIQIHIYQVPGIYRSLRRPSRPELPLPIRSRHLRRRVEANPTLLSDLGAQVDGIPARLTELTKAMEAHLGHPLPVFITEFGMGNATDREVMTSQTSAVLVADMIRVFVSSPTIQGTNKWALYGGYWFSQVNGPSLRRPSTPFYVRPERYVHEIFARCRSEARLPIATDTGQPVSAVVFAHADGPRAILINRSATDWARIDLAIPSGTGTAQALLLTASHPLFGNETDPDLVRLQEFRFSHRPAQPLLVPPMSVLGILLPN
ncbi:MAG: hypothetical protein HN849_24280 [Victivallales bacterium]|nr:hypothetical protein [Victivallales bacterium]